MKQRNVRAVREIEGLFFTLRQQCCSNRNHTMKALVFCFRDKSADVTPHRLSLQDDREAKLLMQEIDPTHKIGRDRSIITLHWKVGKHMLDKDKIAQELDVF